MAKTIQEVEKLKANWKNDPCWDLYETEGFEEYRDELKNFQEECEKEWENQRITKEMRLDMGAESLGVQGLYRLILEHKALLDRHQRAIEALADGENFKAYRILQGYHIELIKMAVLLFHTNF